MCSLNYYQIRHCLYIALFRESVSTHVFWNIGVMALLPIDSHFRGQRTSASLYLSIDLARFDIDFRSNSPNSKSCLTFACFSAALLIRFYSLINDTCRKSSLLKATEKR